MKYRPFQKPQREVCELVLAHVNSNAVEAAYQRSDLFDLRRKLMEQWASYLAVKRDNRGQTTFSLKAKMWSVPVFSFAITR